MSCIRLRRFFRLCGLLLPILLGLALAPASPMFPPACAAEPRALAFWGEYYGHLRGAHAIGLQIRDLGKDRFEGRLLPGGLPGNGACPGERGIRLEGQRSPNQPTLVLEGGGYRVAVRDGVASVYDGYGRWLANAIRVHRQSPSLGATPPPEAIVLFDWRDGSLDELAHARRTAEGFLRRGAETRRIWQDFFLHVEFRTPHMPASRGQQRGNSGIYLQRRYEVQILDSFALEPQIDGAGALYRTKPPDRSASFPPALWQTYDIAFRAARFDTDGRKVEPAIVTVWHNGLLVHHRIALPDKTGAGRPEGPEPGPILFQDHRDDVEYRLIWIIPSWPARHGRAFASRGWCPG